MHIKPFKAVYPNQAIITSPESFFNSVKKGYSQFKKNSFFLENEEIGFYVYRIVTHSRDFFGLLALSDIEDYDSGLIKKHENTIAAKEQKQIELILRRDSMVKPILLTYEPVEDIFDFLYKKSTKDKPLYVIDIPEDEVKHEFWAIDDKDDIDLLQKLFLDEIQNAYIADGHHRSAAISLLNKNFREIGQKKYQHLFTAFFATDQLDVLDYSRVVRLPSKITFALFMARLSKVFYISPLKQAARPREKHELTMYMQGIWYRLKWKKSVLKRYENRDVVLDVHILNQNVLRKIVKVKDIREDPRVTYHPGILPLSELQFIVQTVDNEVAFCLYPADISDVIHQANHDEEMPPKSTYFEPRMKNGMIVHDLNLSND